MFVLYINDLPEVVDKDTFVYLFADDTKLFRKIKSLEDVKILQNDINKLVEWSDRWLLKFHLDKCIYIGIGYNKDNIIEGKYNMNGHILKKSDCEKDIGVYIDSKLKFETHINKAVNKANSILAITRKTFDYMDAQIFKNIFKGLVRPHLEYGWPIWSPHLIKYIDIIENVQRRATKMVPGLSNLSYPERLETLKLPTLTYRRTRGDMIQVYKLLSGGYDEALPNLLKASNTGLRGNSKKLFVEGGGKDVRKYNFNIRVTRLWNSLPDHVVKAKDVKAFEIALDKHWHNQEQMYENHKASIDIKS